MKEFPPNTKVPIHSNKEKVFLCEYRHQEELWGIQVIAESQEDAELRLKNIAQGKILGEIRAVIPYRLGWIAKFLTEIQNIKNSLAFLLKT